MHYFVNDLNTLVNIVICDTLGETDRLPVNSRNAHLSSNERKVSPILYKSLCVAQTMFASHFHLLIKKWSIESKLSSW